MGSQKILSFGGVAVENEKSFDVRMFKQNQNMQSFYKSQAVDDTTFSPVAGTELSLFAGGNTTHLSSQTPQSTIKTDDGGKFEFMNLKPG